MRYNIVLILIMAVLGVGCQAYDAPDNPQPILTVEDATNVTRTEAIVTGTVTGSGGNGLSELCFEWWTADGAPSLSPQLTAEYGEVEYSLHGLRPGCVYNFRLKGSNGRVNIVSDTRQFQTNPNVVPTISGLTPLAKGPASIIASFRIEDNGGEDIVEAGCYIRNINTGKTTQYIADISDMTESKVYVVIRGLEKSSDFEITPYAVNAIGETRGEPIIITTGNFITVTEPGMLATLLGDDRMSYTSLPFSGRMNGDDIRTLREMAGMDFNGMETAGQLCDIDLTDVRLVEGGGNYIPSRYVSDDVVGYGMFQKLSKLKRIQLPNTVKTIEEQAFLDCTALTSITIPAEVTSLTPSDGCTDLKEILVSPANRNYKSVDGVLFNADVTDILWFPLDKSGDYSLPSSVTAIGDYVFRNSRITRFTMPDNITKIGKAVFSGSGVQSVVLSDNLATIPQATFQGCNGLTEVYLGNAAALIGSFAFDGCPLTDIYLSAENPPVCSDGAFSSSYDLMRLCRLHVPENSIQRYKNHPEWGKFEHISQ